MYKAIFLIGFALLAGIAGCRKDKPVTTVDDNLPEVYLRLSHYVDTNAFQMNTTFTDDFGTSYQFTRAQMYISYADLSGISFGSYLLVDTEGTDYRLGEAEPGHYHDLSFSVGVDSATNHEDPSQYPTSHPLGLQTPTTHWGWNPGYLFVMLEGQVDTTGDGTMDDTFIFHVGSDQLYRSTTVTVHQDVPSEGTVYIGLDVDWGNFFAGIDLKADHITHTMNNMPLAMSVANNVSNVFSKTP